MWCVGYGIDIWFFIDGLIVYCWGFGGVICGWSGLVSVFVIYGYFVRVLVFYCWGNIVMDFYVFLERIWMCVIFFIILNLIIIWFIICVDMGMFFFVWVVCKFVIIFVKFIFKWFFIYKRENKLCIIVGFGVVRKVICI